MSKKTKKTKTGVKKITQFEIIRPNVAGIDVSDNDTMMVAYAKSIRTNESQNPHCNQRY